MDAWERADIRLVLSASMVEEIGDVLRRPHIRDRYQVTEEHVVRLERGIARYAEVVPKLDPLPDGISVRDAKDEHVLRAALTGKARYLVSGDDDLLSVELGHFGEELRVVRVGELLSLLSLG